jgi:hypothetical protein
MGIISKGLAEGLNTSWATEIKGNKKRKYFSIL